MNLDRLTQPFVSWWQRISQRRVLAHLLRAIDRYTFRMGDPLSAAITYYSVLSLVPVLMFALAAIGVLLTALRPDWLPLVQGWINLQVADPETQQRLTETLLNALLNWRTLGMVALITAAFAGIGWVGGLKTAIRAQFRESFDRLEPGRMILLEVLHNLAVFVVLLLAVALTFGVSTFATNLADLLLHWVGASTTSSVAVATLRALSVLTSLVTGWVLYLVLFSALPVARPLRAPLVQGSLLGSAGLAILQYLTQLLFGFFSRNLSAAIFGPAIVLMLFFNLFAKLTLFCAAWIATWKPRHLYPQTGNFQI